MREPTHYKIIFLTLKIGPGLDHLGKVIANLLEDYSFDPASLAQD
jgi:hypothetical protein